MKQKKPVFYRLFWGFATLCVIIAATWVGWSQGYRSAIQLSTGASDQKPASKAFRVAGSSMVPTVYGPSLRTVCLGCGQNLLFDAQSVGRVEESLICSFCGERHKISDLSDTSPLTAYAGDIVVVSKSKDANYALGELVAIQREGAISVKRVVATEGDQVDTLGQRLLVSGQRVEDRLANEAGARRAPDLMVDDDSLREKSRWFSGGDSKHWQRNTNRRWSCYQKQVSPWLLYHHRSIHDHDRPSGVMDDYQYNAGIARQLYDVDRLSLSGVLETEGPRALIVAFWSLDGVVVARQRIEESGRFQIRFWDGVPAAIEAARDKRSPVTKEVPVAIRVEGGATSLASLQIRRAIEYWVRPEDQRSQYPMQIPPDRYFVLGDNVPFSIDSRSLGAIEGRRILGTVQIVETIRDDR